MSETDDTEALLLIPPSLFLISSTDSENSFEQLSQKNLHRKHFFIESLADEIGSIQLRLENLESLSFSEQASYSDLCFGENQKKSTSSCFITPTKQCHNKSSVNNYHTFPKRTTSNTLKNHSSSSLKKTYSNKIIKPLRRFQKNENCGVFKSITNKQYNSNAVVNLETRFSISSFDSDSTNGEPGISYHSTETVNMDSGAENPALSPGKRRDKSMLCEIDAFLDGIKKIENNLYNEKESDWIAPVQIRRTETENRFNKESAMTNTADYLSKFIYLPDGNSSEIEMATEESFKEPVKYPITQYGMSNVYSSLNNHHLHELKESLQSINNLPCVNNMISNNIPSVKFSRNNENKDNSLESAVKTIQIDKPNTKLNHQFPDYNSPIDLSNNIKSTLKSHSDQEYIQQSTVNYRSSEGCCNTITENQMRNLHGTAENNFYSAPHNSLLPNQCANHMNDVASRKDESSASTSISSQHFILPSLSELWGSSSGKNFKVSSTDSRNFEEEKLRRQHCETVIQQLQKKLLEQQQRLAVALQVDAAKEEAIRKLRNACSKISNQVNDVEEELTNKISKLDTQLRKTSEENEELKEVNTQHKMEISSAAQLVRSMKEDFKIKQLEKEKYISESQNDVSKLKDILGDREERLAELKESNVLVVNLNRQISDNLKCLQTNFDKERQDHYNTKEVLNEMRKNREQHDDEMNMLKSEKNNLRLIITEEKSRNTHLDGQKSKLQSSLDAVNKKMKSLEAEFETFKNQSEIQKNDLKTCYQKQLETILLNKLNEFKQQTDSAEAVKENELQNRERSVTLQFARQLQLAKQQHQMEIAIFEDRHKEETKLYRVQLARSSQTIQQLEDNISSYKNRRGQIAAQLHSVMENQWQQALQIITNGAGNNQHIHPGVTDHRTSTRHSDRLFDQCQQNTNNTMTVNNAYQPPSTQCFYNEHVNNSQNSNTNERTPSKSQTNNLLHANRNENVQTDLTENGLQHYIKLLLQKPPGSIDLPKEDYSNETKFVKAIKSDSKSPVTKSSDDEYPTRDRNYEITEKKLDKHGNLKKPWK